jgi:hypothetical protein
MRRLRVRVPLRVPVPGGLSEAQHGSELCPRWFDSSPGSNAVAHGCGSAFVPRMIRVGTGWRLHALVAESGRRAVLRWQCSARGVPVQVRASAQCLQLQGRLHADVAQRLAHHLAKVRVASSNLVICSHAVFGRSHAVLAQWQRHRVQGAGGRGSNPRDGTHGE